MSLFIGGLAFSDPLLIEEAKLGTLGGSVLAAIAGYLLLRFAPLHAEHVREEVRQAREIERDGDVESISAEPRSEEHTSELQSLMHSSSAVFCLKKKHHDACQRRHAHTRPHAIHQLTTLS